MNITNSFIIKVKDINDNEYQVYCLGYDHSIEYVKFVLQYFINIDMNKMNLYLDDILLQNWKILSDYDINDKSVLRVYFTMNTGFF